MSDKSIFYFNGRDEIWIIWNVKFQDKTYMNGYSEHLEKYYSFPGKDDQEYEKEKRLHHLRYCELLWCMKKDGDIF